MKHLAYKFDAGRAVPFVENLFDTDAKLPVIDNQVDFPVLQRPWLFGASLSLRF